MDFDSLVDSQRLTVLHVDDEPSLTDLASTFLQRENDAIDVVTETNANDALARLTAEDAPAVDCVVSDYQMPGMDGLELLEAVRERFPDLPFILFTGEGSEAVAGDAISAGVTDYLQKERGTEQYTVLANRIQNSVEKARAERTGEQLLGAVETAKEGISLLGEDGRFIYVNQAYADTYGYERDELLGEHWETLYPDDGVDRVYEEVLPKVPENGVLREDTRMVDADGDELLVDHRLSYAPTGVMVCNVDVPLDRTEQHGLFADVLDSMDDLLFFFGRDGTLEYWNDRVEAVTGYSAAELPGTTPRDFVHEADQERVQSYVEETAETGDARVEARLRLANGETVPYEFVSKPVTGADEGIIGRVGLGRDVSDRKRYQERIERQNDRLEHFAEMLSHDLRNPLTIAMGHFEIYRETGEEQHYETAERALDRMQKLITDVLDLARDGELIASGDYETVELASVAEDAWTLIRTEDATLEILESWPVRADVSRLQQILENLFRNAVEHGSTSSRPAADEAVEHGSTRSQTEADDAVEHGGDAVSVRLGLLDDDGFYVSDDGPGVPESARESVFEPGHSTKSDGTGFGLATVAQLVEAHGWSVRITEGELGGARFEIRGVEFPGEQ